MNRFEEAAELLKNSDAIIITASNGLSISEGLNLFADNEAFSRVFGDFREMYGLSCILQGISGRWPDEESHWAFASRLIDHYCCSYRPTPLMEDLRAIAKDKPHFVVTSNGECHFEASGFDRDSVYEVEGNWSEMVCSRGCNDETQSTTELAHSLNEKIEGCRIPSGLVPRCVHCGAPMRLSMEGMDSPVHQRGNRNFNAFLEKYGRGKVTVLELGIGWRNQLIKGPMMRLVAANSQWSYITVNKGEVYIPAAIAEQSIGFDMPISEALAGLKA